MYLAYIHTHRNTHTQGNALFPDSEREADTQTQTLVEVGDEAGTERDAETHRLVEVGGEEGLDTRHR